MTQIITIFRRSLGFLIYLTGAALAMLLFVLVIWPDIEASFFDHAIQADYQMRSLRCPALMTKDEVGTISIEVKNTTDRDVAPNVRARITFRSGSFIEQLQKKVPIPVGESRTVEWQVDRENVAYDRMILGRFYQFANLALPSRTATCGIYILPFSGPSGQQVLIGGFLGSLGLMVVGLVMFLPKDWRNLSRIRNQSVSRQRKRLKAFVYLGGLFLVGILLALIGNWLLSLALAVLVTTSIIGVISYALSAH